MREILLRGKRISYDDDLNGKWTYGQLVIRPDTDDGDDKYFICESGHRFIRCLSKMHCTYEVDPETIGQYTGLNDKNGKRIFEGDIISAKLENGAYKDYTWPNMPVAFRQGAFCLIDKKGDIFCVLGAFVPSATFEVVGNIHDNKEMLCAEVAGC